MVKPETLYQKIKTNLQKPDVDHVGEMIKYQDAWNYSTVLQEEVDIFVAPKEEMGFDNKRLSDFANSLKLPGVNALWMGFDWTYLSLEKEGFLRRFTLGVIYYSEPLRDYDDLLEPTIYTDKIRSLPELNCFHSSRGIHIYIYPSREYANQIFVYEKGLADGNKPNQLMDWLSHSVTQEQIEAIMQAGDKLKLGELPPLPKLYKGPWTGK